MARKIVRVLGPKHASNSDCLNLFYTLINESFFGLSGLVGFFRLLIRRYFVFGAQTNHCYHSVHMSVMALLNPTRRSFSCVRW